MAVIFFVLQDAIDKEEGVRLNTTYRQWVSKSVEARKKLCMPLAAKPWTGRPEVKLLGVPTGSKGERLRDCIDVGFEKSKKLRAKMKGQRPPSTAEECAKDVRVDISQNVDRLPVSVGSIPCLTTRSLLYDYGHDCVLSGKMHMRFLGWPSSFLATDKFHDHTLRELAGEGFSLPIASLMELGCFLNPHADWWR